MGQDSNLHAPKRRGFTVHCPTEWASHGWRKGRESNPLGQYPDDFRSRVPDHMASLPRCACALAEGEGVEPPEPRGAPPRSRRLGVPMPNPPAEGEGIEPPLISRPDHRFPSECLAARPTFQRSSCVVRRRERESNPRWRTRPRRSKPVPYHSAIPPRALQSGLVMPLQSTITDDALDVEGATILPTALDSALQGHDRPAHVLGRRHAATSGTHWRDRLAGR